MRIRIQHRSSIAARLFVGAATFGSIAALTGCSGMMMSTGNLPAAAGTSLHGTAKGGQQPLTGARIYLFAAGATGYASASPSLLNTAIPAVSTDLSGNGYVLTDATGSFTITGDWTCAHASDQVYVLATGGNPGLAPGTNNSAIVLMDALGTCSTLSSSTFIVVNELSTVAAVTALQQFMTDGTHVGSSATNPTGLANAFASATNMVDIAAVSARTTTPAGNGDVPQSKLHSLANILATCVNTSAGTSAECATLFTAATPSGGTAPDNSLAAALDIALNPSNNVATIYAISTPIPPFQPSLTAAPSNWTFGVTYSLGGTPLPGYFAIDAAGNVWITNLASEKAVSPAGTDSVIKIGPTGAVLSGATGFTAGGVHLPEGLAIDDTGNVWIANTSSSVIKLTNAGTLVSGFPFIGGNFPQGIALDIAGNAWVSNSQGADIMEISPGGSLLNDVTSTGFTNGQGVAIDTSGNVWAVGQGSNSLLKLSGAGAVLSGTGSGFAGAGLDAPSGAAIDATGHVFVVNSTFAAKAPSISKFNNNGTAANASAYPTGTKGFENLLAIDGAGTVWSVVCGPRCIGSGTDYVVHLASDGTVLTPAGGIVHPSLSVPQAVAVDASGNLWVGNSAGQSNSTPGTVTEFIGIASPVKTPIQSALKSSLLGQRP